MMSVLEYAEDVNKTVSEILSLCKKLNISAGDEEDMLDEDAITLLDNSIDEIIEEEELEDLEYEDELIEKENTKIENIVNNSKQKKQTQKLILQQLVLPLSRIYFGQLIHYCQKIHP